MKAIIVGSIVLVSAVAATLFLVMNLVSRPGEPETTANGALETYVGKLTAGTSLMPFGGEPIVEITFEDGRMFTASEQLAKQANMTIGKTYQITYNSTAPSVAVKILCLSD